MADMSGYGPHGGARYGGAPHGGPPHGGPHHDMYNVSQPPPMYAPHHMETPHTTNTSRNSTNVVINQQPQGVVFREARPWQTGICACFEDISTCCGVLLCPPCYLCYLSSTMNEWICMPLVVPEPVFALRLKLRARHHIAGSITSDFCISTFCYLCAMCQIAREYKGITQAMVTKNIA